MAAVIALVALTLFMWAVAVWATLRDEPEEPTRKEGNHSMDRSTKMRKAA